MSVLQKDLGSDVFQWEVILQVEEKLKPAHPTDLWNYRKITRYNIIT